MKFIQYTLGTHKFMFPITKKGGGGECELVLLKQFNGTYPEMGKFVVTKALLKNCECYYRSKSRY